MATKRAPTTPAAPAPNSFRPPYMLIEQIQVKGYKSLVDATLHVRPLTLLAGTNSSGKSSIMQPLLLIKQTMEAPYQPAGALVLNGAHVQAETAEELLTSIVGCKTDVFAFRVSGKDYSPPEPVIVRNSEIELFYQKNNSNFLTINQNSYLDGSTKLGIALMSWNGLEDYLSDTDINTEFSEIRQRNGFLYVDFHDSQREHLYGLRPSYYLERALGVTLHIPGLRDIPKRAYLATTYQDQIKGTFDLYAAGTISQWQQQENVAALAKLNDYLRRLGLTNFVEAKVKNANEVELSVNRLPAGSKAKPKKADMVNIADVGIGVSQVLPILVALIAAQEGQLVYVEQPELHLHPRAQVAMAELLAEAANRGVRVIVETHSSLLLLTVQTLIAEAKIKHTDVALHWFARDAKGATQVTYVQPDEDGAYGAWPEDFGDVELKAQDAYLTAVGLRQFGAAAK